MKQAIVAKMAGVSRGYVSQIANGKIANSRNAEKIKIMLEITEKEFLGYFFWDDRIFKVLEAGVQHCRRSNEKRFAVEFLMAIEQWREKNPKSKSQK